LNNDKAKELPEVEVPLGAVIAGPHNSS